MLRDDVAEGLGLVEAAGLPFDLVAVLPRHLEHVDHLSQRFPDLTIVIDHLAKPPIGSDRRSPWCELMARAATNPRVVAKLSGLYRAGDGPPPGDDDLRPWIADAIELFGPDRLLVGSDWPVAESAGGYRSVTGSVIRVVRDLLDDSDAARVLAGTAIRRLRTRADREIRGRRRRDLTSIRVMISSPVDPSPSPTRPAAGRQQHDRRDLAGRRS